MKNNSGEIQRLMKARYDEYITLNLQLLKQPDNQELAKSAAYANQTFLAWKNDYSEIKAIEDQIAIEEAEFGAPDEDWEETDTQTIT